MHALARAILAAVPVVGSVLAEAFDRFFPSPIEKKRAQWFNAASGKLVEHDADIIEIKQGISHKTVEEGRNANGEYRRYSSGLQQVSEKAAIKVEPGRTSYTFVFPAAFVRPPLVQIIPQGLTAIEVTPLSLTIEGFSILDREVIVSYRAIGIF